MGVGGGRAPVARGSGALTGARPAVLIVAAIVRAAGSAIVQSVARIVARIADQSAGGNPRQTAPPAASPVPASGPAVPAVNRSGPHSAPQGRGGSPRDVGIGARGPGDPRAPAAGLASPQPWIVTGRIPVRLLCGISPSAMVLRPRPTNLQT